MKEKEHKGPKRSPQNYAVMATKFSGETLLLCLAENANEARARMPVGFFGITESHRRMIESVILCVWQGSPEFGKWVLVATMRKPNASTEDSYARLDEKELEEIPRFPIHRNPLPNPSRN